MLGTPQDPPDTFQGGCLGAALICHLPHSPSALKTSAIQGRWDPRLPKPTVPGSRLLIAAYFQVSLYQEEPSLPGSTPGSTGHAAHTGHGRLALAGSAAGCLVSGQRSGRGSQPSPGSARATPTIYWPGGGVPGGHLAPPAMHGIGAGSLSKPLLDLASRNSFL